MGLYVLEDVLGRGMTLLQFYAIDIVNLRTFYGELNGEIVSSFYYVGQLLATVNKISSIQGTKRGFYQVLVASSEDTSATCAIEGGSSNMS